MWAWCSALCQDHSVNWPTGHSSVHRPRTCFPSSLGCLCLSLPLENFHFWVFLVCKHSSFLLCFWQVVRTPLCELLFSMFILYITGFQAILCFLQWKLFFFLTSEIYVYLRRRKWQPTPVFLPGKSQGWGSLVGCHLWGLTESEHYWSDLAAAAASLI